jgi:SAM-dependent methyltransferase
MIHAIPHEVSDGLRAENEIHNGHIAPRTTDWLRANYPTAADFVRYYAESAEGIQLLKAFAAVKPGAAVLDVGAGYGLTAVFLASRGYRVSAVEPSRGLCDYIDRAATLYGLPLDVYHVCGEGLDRMPPREFDVCMFNASLHHCDDPVRALTHCHRLLKPDGQLLLMNEPILRFFRSKGWFQNQLEYGTLVTGDYGGNEHTYYYHEYRDMLRRAGFRRIRDRVAQRYLNPKSYVAVLSAHHRGPLRIVGRRLYYGVIRGLFRLGFLGAPFIALMKRLSLLQTNFVATK